MRFETSQQMRLGQHMKLAPRMIQSMEILQMPLVELEERIEQELEGNVTLELVEAMPDPDEAPAQEADTQLDDKPLTVDEKTGTDDFARLDTYEQLNPDAAENEYSASGMERFADYQPASSQRIRDTGERDSKMEAMANTPARAASLVDQLRGQWGLADVDERIFMLGELLIANIEDDGYIRTPLEAIADRAPHSDGKPVTEADLEQALVAVQLLLDPPGVGARDLRECLLLQLDALEDSGAMPDKMLLVVRMLSEQYLEDMMQNRLPRIAEKSGLSLDEVKAGIKQFRKLNPAPARMLVDESLPPIIPDAVVEFDEEGDRYIAYLNDTRLMNLRINRMYAEMSRDKQVPKKDRDFIKTNLSNATWLIDALGQRRHTVQRVLNVVVDAQRDYFDYGPQALKPLPMTQVADQLGIHVATVSRAVADKYLQTPRGIVPLRGFFSGGLQTQDGEEMSYDAVKAALKEVIDAEDKAKPLSDETLVEQLKSKGIEIARRTVAKYRGQLGIPSARLRKTY